MEKIKFEAAIIQHQHMNAAYLEFPFSAEEKFGKKGQVKIKAVFEKNVEYCGSLANMGQGCHVLGLTQAVRKQLGKTFGDVFKVELSQDQEERIVEIPKDVAELFCRNEKAKELFDAMSYTHRKEYIRWIL